MRQIDVVYSPMCEATAAMVEKLRIWLEGIDIQINLIPYHQLPSDKKNLRKCENCFIDVYDRGRKIDTVPLHKQQLYAALQIERNAEDEEPVFSKWNGLTEEQFKNCLHKDEISFIPITKHNYLREMSMCLTNYPFGNPSEQYHQSCISLKSKVFSEIWQKEDIAGIFAVLNDRVIGLLEVIPREILQKYGYMTGTAGNSDSYLTIGCYEVGYGVPRVEMLDALMENLEKVYPLFHRKYLEGIGIYEWRDGFNPYWVYEKHGYSRTEKLADNIIVMSKKLCK